LIITIFEKKPDDIVGLPEQMEEMRGTISSPDAIKCFTVHVSDLKTRLGQEFVSFFARYALSVSSPFKFMSIVDGL
jgi:hypothetical protein